MTETQIEAVYEALAAAIDRAGPANEALFLAKLALLLGQRVGDPAVFAAAVEIALQDLDAPAQAPAALA